ncbi:hypothetical protein GOFOIKOB_5231 [Methylobacterium tardum]|nr:hypothetical protein GOFOIKOB_5231 [Methylobacterium tardum]
MASPLPSTLANRPVGLNRGLPRFPNAYICTALKARSEVVWVSWLAA